ncbi:MAG: aminotransferase class V-fold PLP-dependent enzyme [Candidatus Hodarchaeota archaeon]
MSYASNQSRVEGDFVNINARVYRKMGLHEIINARGPATSIGNTIMDSEVLDAMVAASKFNVEMDKLQKAASKIIARITGAEAGYVTSGAAAGIVIATAACMTGTNLFKIKQLPNSKGMKNEVIIQRGHMCWFEHMIRMAGARIVDVGNTGYTLPGCIEGAINENTVAIAYIIGHMCVQKGMLPLQKVVEIAKKADIPTIVDAAGERNLKKYVATGADLVIYSGGKAIGGPGNSGFICGREDLVKACVLQGKGIGRPMKTSKEDIIGLLTALERYATKDHAPELRRQHAIAKYIVDQLKGIPNIDASKKKGEVRKLEARAELILDEEALGFTAFDLYRMLKDGDPSIHVRDEFANLGIIQIDPTYLLEDQEKVVVKRLKEILTLSH